MHPTKEQLTAFAFDPIHKGDADLCSHIDICGECRSFVENIERMGSTLKSIQQPLLVDIDAGHLSDDQIIAYGNKSLSVSEMEAIKVHISSCGACAKAVLLHRTHVISYQQEDVAKTTETQAINNIKKRVSIIDLIKEWLSPKHTGIAFASIVLLITVSMLIVYKNIYQLPPNDPAIVAQKQESRVEPDKVVGIQQGLMPAAVLTQTTASGINWYGGYVETTGVGTADMNKMKNKIQAESIAEKAARHIAYAQISEILNGVHITNEVTYKELLTEVDALAIQHQGFIRGAHVINKSVQWLDGVPKAMVTIRVPLYGNSGLDRAIGPVPQTQLLFSGTGSVGEELLGKTGLVIDARNTNFRPTLRPKIKIVNNGAVFVDNKKPLADINAPYDSLYYPTIEAAVALPGVGADPVIIQANIDSGEGELVLDNSFSGQIYAMLNNSMNNKKNVAIVY